MTGFVLSVDEVRALHRLLGLWLPGFLAYGDDADPIVDATALRGLAARSYVSFRQDDVVPLPPLVAITQAFENATLAVEVTTERYEYAFSTGTGGAAAALEGLSHGLVRCCATDGDQVTEIATRSGLDQVLRKPAYPEWTVDNEIYASSDDLALAGDEHKAVAVLVDAGTPPRVARSWVTALRGRYGSAAVTAARRDIHSGRLEAAELRWLVDETGGAWRITADARQTMLTPVDATDLVTALREMCE